MSLKAFHVVFVMFSVLISLGFGGWCLRRYQLTHEASALIVGAVSVVFGVLAVVYGRWFVKKLKGESYL